MEECVWIFYNDYYETDCSNQMEEEDMENISPVYCPYCGCKIKFE